MYMINKIWTRPEKINAIINDILSLSWIDSQCEEVSRWMFSDGRIITWPFFDWFHSEAEVKWHTWVRIYHLRLANGQELIISYEKLEINWITTLSLWEIKDIPGVLDKLLEIRNIEEHTRVTQWITLTVRDRVHDTI